MTVNKMIKNVTNNDLYKYLNKEFYSWSGGWLTGTYYGRFLDDFSNFS
jgi:hypothetical protein